MAEPNYDINYDDERFQQVEFDKNNAIADLETTYESMIGKTDKFYQDQIDATNQYAETQKELQSQQTQHTIDQINQQKDKAHKDYIKEQSGAYVDWQKQSNQYGANAEKMASAGLQNTGFSESSQVSMYNTYQNRVATAREVFASAVLNYDNAIKDAQLQNSSVLAEIAYNALQQQLELSLQGFQYKNNLILEQAQRKTEMENQYYNRYLDVLNQINTENAMAEDIRQFGETMEFNKTQAELDRQHQSTENQLNREFQAAQAELDRKHQSEMAELERQHDFAMLEAQTKKEKELLARQHANAMAKLKAQQKAEKELLEQQQQQTEFIDGGTANHSSIVQANRAQKMQAELTGYGGATDYFNAMVASGATKAQITLEINNAQKNGVLTANEARELKRIFTPSGMTY